jgi:predicted dehydrogenase
MEKLGMAIAGVGRIGMTHIVAMSQAENVELLAVVEPNEQLGREVSAKFNCSYYKQISDLAGRDDIKAVNICVPEEYHLSATEEAAGINKHIMIEKPIAKTSADGNCMKKVTEDKGVRLMVAHTCHFIAQYRKIREELQGGKIGELCQVSIRRFAPRSTMEYVKGRVSILYYVAIHDLDAIQWLSGHKIKSVFAKKINKLNAYGEDGYAILFTFDNGACGTMDVGWNFPATYPKGLTKFEIIGSEGVLFYDMMKEGISEYFNQEIPVSPSIGFLEGKMVGAYMDQLQHFAYCVLSGANFAVDTDSVIYSVKIVEAILRSSESGKCEIV